jgi:hypothetical protein
MRWSKLKQRIEATFADSIKKDIKVFNTAYKKAYDSESLSRSWIEVEKKEIVNFCDYASESVFQAFYHEDTPTICLKHRRITKEERNPKNLSEKGEFSSLDFKEMGFSYLNTSAQNCIKSQHPLLRALGSLNKKIGKNKLKELIEDQHPLVSFLAKYRLNQEVNCNLKLQIEV